jgi:prepilin-type N-terminal cleavage/methylation domain-containing protein
MRKQRGFSLVELLVVVAIILIISAIAIPRVIRARIAANESATVAELRTIFSAEAVYESQGWQNPTSVGYSAALADLGNTTCNPPNLISACLLDDALANSGTVPKNGYLFTYKPVTVAGKNMSFTVNADPVQRGMSGFRSFFTDPSGIIRVNENTVASASDPAI